MVEETKIPNNLEIDQALKEFEEKSRAEQTQKTAGVLKTSDVPAKEVLGVKFETDSYKAANFYDETDIPKMIKLIMKLSSGKISTPQQAQKALLALIVLALAVTLYLIMVKPILNRPPESQRGIQSHGPR